MSKSFKKIIYIYIYIYIFKKKSILKILTKFNLHKILMDW
jgi:hypothetical protein